MLQPIGAMMIFVLMNLKYQTFGGNQLKCTCMLAESNLFVSHLYMKHHYCTLLESGS